MLRTYEKTDLATGLKVTIDWYKKHFDEGDS